MVAQGKFSVKKMLIALEKYYVDNGRSTEKYRTENMAAKVFQEDKK